MANYLTLAKYIALGLLVAWTITFVIFGIGHLISWYYGNLPLGHYDQENRNIALFLTVVILTPIGAVAGIWRYFRQRKN